MKLNVIIAVILGFSILFVTGQAYAPCIEGPGINCNNYPPPSLTQIKFDKLNYDASDKPIVTIMGAPDAVAHLEIDDSSSNIIFTHDINLAPNGTVNYVLDVSFYKPGMYSVIATSPISKLTTSFTVGLMPTGGGMFLNTDKNSYLLGDRVKILGTMNSNTLVQLSLINPNGIPVESTQTFSDNTGHFSLLNFTIPQNAISGAWKISAISGVEHTQIPITVNSTLSNISNIKMDTTIPSPLKQFKMGTFAQGVQCNTGLQLFFKAEDYTPVCAQSGTVTVLLKRGWATTHPPEPFVKKIAITGLQQNYTIGQPINAVVNYAGYYWYTEPDVKILDANGTQIWFNCPYCYTRSTPLLRPSLDAFTYIVRDYASNNLPVINKTGTYTMIASLDNYITNARFDVISNTNENDLKNMLSNSTSDSPDFKIGSDLLGPIPHQLVFFIKSNSTAKIFVKYTSHESNTGTMPSYSSVYVGKGGEYDSLTTSGVTIHAYPSAIPLTQGSDTVVVYNITTKEGVKGVYWIFLAQFCRVMPVAIDMDSLTVSPFDIPVQTGNMNCPAQFLDGKILGISGGTAEYKIGQPVK